ncbi:MAG: DUF4115 domain-containing protein [Chloroflexota bacterium]|nr:DUF4115 domain-containing protein [Chloroflexota bacterium]
MGTFGDTLRQAREDLGVSLADAERETRISRRYLEALETEDEASLPAPVYTRGFIRTYCRYLGLNGDGMLDLFGPRQALESSAQVRPIPAELHTPSSLPVRPVVLAASVVLAVLLVGYLWSQYTSFVESVSQLESVPTSRGATAIVPGAVRSPEPSPTPVAVASPFVPPVAAPSPSPVATPERGLTVEVAATERSWLEVWIDGRSVLAETIQPGVTRSFSAEQQVRMRVGNAAGIRVTVNGATQGPLGARGQAVDAIWGRQ